MSELLSILINERSKNIRLKNEYEEKQICLWGRKWYVWSVVYNIVDI